MPPPSADDPSSTRYQKAGVHIDRANTLIENIKILAHETPKKGVLSGIGGFGALYELPTTHQQPVLVAGTDGVGTKLMIAQQLQQHDTIGIDLVAMCANDVLCQGATPLFFLDYYATSALDPAQATAVLAGITEGCRQAHMALIGGETAEMPGMYSKDDYDLAGFCVGLVDKNQIIDGHSIEPNDVIIGLAASGPHANGYSLIRQVIKEAHADLSDPFENSTLGDVFLTPTTIYVEPILALLQKVSVHGIAHITGGGLTDNIPRILPPHTQALIDQRHWEWPAIFHWLQQKGNIPEADMQHTFNLGIGMVVIVRETDVDSALTQLTAHGAAAKVIGRVHSHNPTQPTLTFTSAQNGPLLPT